MKIKTKHIIEIDGHRIELTETELIELRDKLNKLTDYDRPVINFPELPDNTEPWGKPYKHYPISPVTDPYNPINPWHNPPWRPNEVWY